MFRTGERFEAIPTLNRVATDIMKTHDIAIDDLYAFVLPQVQAWQDPDECHFNSQGNEQLGKQVAACILNALHMETNQSATTSELSGGGRSRGPWRGTRWHSPPPGSLAR